MRLTERDAQIVMRDGVRLFANVFRPDDGERHPVVLSATPYGKDILPDRLNMFFMRLSGVRFGTMSCSKWTGFESPDPAFWTEAGYNVVQYDVRGMHKSEGRAGAFTSDDAEDYAEVIRWCSKQPWSTGAVGLCGVSYLAMSQWRVAALRPDGLKAMIPWEGATDYLREFAYQDGVRESRFIWFWWNMRMRRGHNRRFALAEDFMKERDEHPLDDAFWAVRRPMLEAIDIPTLVCASWSDHGLHTRGSFLGFEGIRSADKWLFTHGRRKWETFYGKEARETQRRFFDYFLKGIDNGWPQTPRVRLAVRTSLTEAIVRAEQTWPLESVTYTPLYLNAQTHQLEDKPVASVSTASYHSAKRKAPDRASFTHRFNSATELTGSMTLRLWVSTSEGNDLDIFVKLRKFDSSGREVFFYGYNGFDRDGVAKGWLKASHREIDAERSRPGMPWHAHRRAMQVVPNEIVPVEIEILASSTLFEPGSVLRVDVLGRDADRYPAFRHTPTINRGEHTIHTGADYDSHLLAPIVQRKLER